jgi:hypothetical protein
MTLMIVALLAVPAAAKDKKPEPAPAAVPLPASVDGLPIGAIPKQQLPAKGCAAFLWSTTPSHALIAMANADPATIRLSIGGGQKDFAMTAQNGGGTLGFSQTTTYQGGDLTATLDISIATKTDLTNGASIPEGTLQLDQAGKDSVVIPVAGLIGCSA